MDSFLVLLIVTVFLRGVGSGMITGILALTMPVRSRMELTPYAQFIRTMYQAWGVKVYAATTILGFLLTAVLLYWSLEQGEDAIVTGFIAISLVATGAGFVGTVGAFPTMKRLWVTPDAQPKEVSNLLTRFERWGVGSAASHLVAFASLLGVFCVRQG